MRKNLIILFLSLLIFLSFYNTASADYSFWDEVSYDYTGAWWFTLVGGSAGSPTGTVDFVTDLYMKDKNPLVFTAKWTWHEKNNIGVSYFTLENQGQTTIGRNFVYKGVPFNSGDFVDSKLKVTVFDVAYERNLYSWDEGYLNFLAGVRFTNIDLNMFNETRGTVVHHSLNSPLPEIGLVASHEFDDGLVGKLKLVYFDYSNGGRQSRVQDYSFGIKYFVLPGWSIGADYRYSRLYGKDSSGSDLDVFYQGPVLTIDYQY